MNLLSAPKRLMLAKAGLTSILLCLVCMPVGAITLTRCKIDHKFVYSDTDCPASKSNSARRRGQSEFSSGPASRKVTVKLPKKQSVGMKVPRKTRSSKASK